MKDYTMGGKYRETEPGVFVPTKCPGLTQDEILKRLDAIRCWLAPDAKSVETARQELDSLINDIQEGRRCTR